MEFLPFIFDGSISIADHVSTSFEKNLIKLARLKIEREKKRNAYKKGCLAKISMKFIKRSYISRPTREKSWQGFFFFFFLDTRLVWSVF